MEAPIIVFPANCTSSLKGREGGEVPSQSFQSSCGSFSKGLQFMKSHGLLFLNR